MSQKLPLSRGRTTSSLSFSHDPQRSSGGRQNLHPTPSSPSHLNFDLLRLPISPPLPAHQNEMSVSEPEDAGEQQAELITRQVMQDHPSKASPESRSSPLQQQAEYQSKKASITVPLSMNVVSPGAGQPLDEATRALMEPRFGFDLSQVRIYTDEQAAAAACALNADAYTVGHHIIFDQGEYAPATMQGKRLLAHELAHVVVPSSEPAIQRMGKKKKKKEKLEKPFVPSPEAAWGTSPLFLPNTTPGTPMTPASPMPTITETTQINTTTSTEKSSEPEDTELAQAIQMSLSGNQPPTTTMTGTTEESHEEKMPQINTTASTEESSKTEDAELAKAIQMSLSGNQPPTTTMTGTTGTTEESHEEEIQLQQAFQMSLGFGGLAHTSAETPTQSFTTTTTNSGREEGSSEEEEKEWPYAPPPEAAWETSPLFLQNTTASRTQIESQSMLQSSTTTTMQTKTYSPLSEQVSIQGLMHKIKDLDKNIEEGEKKMELANKVLRWKKDELAQKMKPYWQQLQSKVETQSMEKLKEEMTPLEEIQEKYIAEIKGLQQAQTNLSQLLEKAKTRREGMRKELAQRMRADFEEKKAQKRLAQQQEKSSSTSLQQETEGKKTPESTVPSHFRMEEESAQKKKLDPMEQTSDLFQKMKQTYTYGTADTQRIVSLREAFSNKFKKNYGELEQKLHDIANQLDSPEKEDKLRKLRTEMRRVTKSMGKEPGMQKKEEKASVPSAEKGAPNPIDPENWKMAGTVEFLNETDKVNFDSIKGAKEKLELLRQGQLTPFQGSARTNKALHIHLQSGDQGLGFAYLLGKDGMIHPCVIDYADGRKENKYTWGHGSGVSPNPDGALLKVQQTPPAWLSSESKPESSTEKKREEEEKMEETKK